MKLLLDQNVSYRLIASLSQAFPGSRHVKDFDLTQEEDEEIWRFAAEHGYVIVSKDSDFLHRALVRGHAPKIIYLRVGNCTTGLIRDLLLAEKDAIRAFYDDPTESVLILG